GPGPARLHQSGPHMLPLPQAAGSRPMISPFVITTPEALAWAWGTFTLTRGGWLRKGDSALVTLPWQGSVWLADVQPPKDGSAWWVGSAWDDSEVGSPFYPEDFRGQPYAVGFTPACVRVVEAR